MFYPPSASQLAATKAPVLERRKKKIIPIVDPTSGEAIDVENLYPKPSTEATPPPAHEGAVTASLAQVYLHQWVRITLHAWLLVF